MEYAIATYYIESYGIYRTLSGKYFYYSLERFIPFIAEQTHLLFPFPEQIEPDSKFEQIQKQIFRLEEIQKEFDKYQEGKFRVISLQEDQQVLFSVPFPKAPVYCCSLEAISSFQEPQQENTANLKKQEIRPSEFLAFLRYMVQFSEMSFDSLWILYQSNPSCTQVCTQIEWLDQGKVIPAAAFQKGIFLPLQIQEQFFQRGSQEYPIEYALDSERRAIFEQKIPVTLRKQNTHRLVFDTKDITGQETLILRYTAPQQIYEVFSELARMQGIAVQIQVQLQDSVYLPETNTILLPASSIETLNAKRICREYTAALVHKTYSFAHSKVLNLLADSLYYMLLYQYGLEPQEEFLQCYYQQLYGKYADQSLAFAEYLYCAFQSIQKNVSSQIEVKTEMLVAQETENPFSSGTGKSAFKNLKGESA